jgi:hypothetical protein
MQYRSPDINKLGFHSFILIYSLILYVFEYELLRRESLDLRDEFKAEYPASVCPVFLGRNPDKSLTPLFWRYSKISSCSLLKH